MNELFFAALCIGFVIGVLLGNSLGRKGRYRRSAPEMEVLSNGGKTFVRAYNGDRNGPYISEVELRP